MINTGDLEVANFISNLPKDELLTYSAGLSNGELPILILSQYTSRYDATSKLLPDFVVDFFRIISRQKKVNVTVRLHPKTAEDHIAKRHSIKSLQDQLHF